jgi:hypothetical protein
MQIWSWFLRRTNIDTVHSGACRYCASPLLLCPGCKGNWRAHCCRNCSLGLRCPTHRTYWLAR